MNALAGRRDEQRRIDRLLDDVRGGRGGALVLAGPAGIGKTFLAEAAIRRARALDLPVARGYAVDDPGAPALWPWSRAMRGWADLPTVDTADLGESDVQARFRLFVAVTEALRDRATPAGLVLVLEDFHWADVQSVRLLRHVAAELADLPVAVVVTARDDEPGPFADAGPELLRADHLHRLTLRGLGVDEVAEWLAGSTGQADRGYAARLVARTGGNPLLVRMIVEDAATAGAQDGDTVAPELGRLVTSRLADLDPQVRELVDAASVLAERIHPQLLARMTGRTADSVAHLLDAAMAAGVLRSSDDGIVFRHALVRDSVYGQLPWSRSQQLHRRAAVALAEADGPAGSIARHWHEVLGPDAVEACGLWAERAVDAAQAVLAHDDAARFARMAVDCARQRGAGPAELARLLVRLAETLADTGAAEAGVDASAEAADLADSAQRPELMAAAALAVQGFGEPEVLRIVTTLCHRALERVDPGDHAARARLLAKISVDVTETDGPGGAELARQALAEADRSGDPIAVLEALEARHQAVLIPQTVAERLELGRRAVEVGRSAHHPMAALWGHLWRAQAAMQLGNLAAFDNEVTELSLVARRHASPLAQWHVDRHTALRASLVGDFRTARAANEAALALGVRTDDTSLLGMSYAFSAAMALVRGDEQELLPNWEQVIRRAPPMPIVTLTLPLVLAAQGDTDAAWALYEPLRHHARTYPVGVRWAGTIALLGMTATMLGDADVAGVCLHAYRDIGHYYAGDGSGAVFSHGAVPRLLGEWALAAGRPDEAVAHHRVGVAMNTRIGARPFVAIGRLGWARSLRAAGLAADPETAATPGQLLDLAVAELRRLDMPGPLAAAEAEAARATTAGCAASSPLTRREQEIAGLVADGLSNREIAARLVLSERTIETHVRNILTKLDLRTRTQIAVWSVAAGADGAAR